MSKDGGVRAISGFLYQVLAGGALRASGDCGDLQKSDSEELNALIQLAADGQVIHEVADEDLVIRTQLVDPASKQKSKVTLVQAKFSVSGTAKSIGPAELKEIIDALYAAGKRLKADGSEVAGYFLVTNRSVTTEKPTLSGLKQPIYDQLKTIPDAKISRWHASFEKFGQRFGLLESEIVSGRQKLLGKIFENTTSGITHGEITRAYLLECLGGGTHAQELHPWSRASQMKEDLVTFDSDVPPVAIRREQLKNIEQECAGRALVVFAGPGGMGKTAALSQWAEDLVGRSEQRQIAPLVAVNPAFALPGEWMVELVKSWNPALQVSNRQEALDRLEAANRTSVPVLHLGLDGVDESRG